VAAADVLSDVTAEENGRTATAFLSCPYVEAVTAFSEAFLIIVAVAPAFTSTLAAVCFSPVASACSTAGLDSLGSFLAWKLYFGSGCLSKMVSVPFFGSAPTEDAMAKEARLPASVSHGQESIVCSTLQPLKPL
jgi:hypothetical protein